jgi:hypothetical protein
MVAPSVTQYRLGAQHHRRTQHLIALAHPGHAAPPSWQHLTVRFHAEHHFTAPATAVATLLTDPSFYLGLVLPDLSQPEVLEQRADGATLVVRLRYQFQGNLDPIAQRLLGADRLAWIQEVRVDPSAGSGTLRFDAEKDPRKLHGAADFVLTESEDGTVRHLDGELVVAVPGIGRMAERRIVPGVLQRLDLEAQAIEDQLGRGRS